MLQYISFPVLMMLAVLDVTRISDLPIFSALPSQLLEGVGRGVPTSKELWRVTQDIADAKTAISYMHSNTIKLADSIAAHPFPCNGLDNLATSFQEALNTSNQSLMALDKNFFNFIYLLAADTGFMSGEIHTRLRDHAALPEISRIAVRVADIWTLPFQDAKSPQGLLDQSIAVLSTRHLDILKDLYSNRWDPMVTTHAHTLDHFSRAKAYANPLEHFSRAFESLVGGTMMEGCASIDTLGLDIGALAQEQKYALGNFSAAEHNIRRDLQSSELHLRTLYKDIRILARTGGLENSENPLAHLQAISQQILLEKSAIEDDTKTLTR